MRLNSSSFEAFEIWVGISSAIHLLFSDVYLCKVVSIKVHGLFLSWLSSNIPNRFYIIIRENSLRILKKKSDSCFNRSLVRYATQDKRKLMLEKIKFIRYSPVAYFLLLGFLNYAIYLYAWPTEDINPAVNNLIYSFYR